ncbi:MAG: UDP-N-acetylmuramoyl-L-alanyl-D-glutamate--2,6-diaminopimelate ligase [Clostridiales bacterium]|nr:UDP-N-acetylmuramoyl-L-alanyl-D-glutamate--2,6-diaminopimelate ligase [Clostridiales bacterium]
MYLQQILNGVSYQAIGEGNPEITSLSCDTSTVKSGCLFFCLKGKRHDGHAFFRKAIGDGAVAIVCEHPLETQALQIVVEDVRSVMCIAAKNFYGNCVDRLKVISIVGTNGKTSTSYILEAILTKAGHNVAVVGTNGIFFNGQRHTSALTTPDPIDLHYWFMQMYLNKVDTVIMEVSAHAIALRKIDGIVSDVAIFTNFSQDHLDFFGTMEKYAATKKSFFDKKYVKNVVANVDDGLGREITKLLPSATYSINEQGDVVARDLKIGKTSSTFNVNVFGQETLVTTHLAGQFNVYNTLAAITCASVLGVDIDTITSAVDEVTCVAGRNETLIRSDDVRIVVDFAHTPDGIHNILSFLKGTCEGKLIVVFGCGGNRDKFKRPLMGQVVSKFADFAVLTNDNPRYEDPKLIAQDVSERLSCKYKVILNRSQATEYALSIACGGDTVAILGKGAEEYQEIRGRKSPYSDVEVVRSLLRSE